VGSTGIVVVVVVVVVVVAIVVATGKGFDGSDLAIGAGVELLGVEEPA
jgi:hypothetical protein